MKLVITKVTSDQEQLQCTIEGRDATDIRDKSQDAFRLMDDRLIESNKRIMDVHQYLQKAPMEVRQMVDSIFMVQFGRANEDTVRQLMLAAQVMADKEKIVAEHKAREAGVEVVEAAPEGVIAG